MEFDFENSGIPVIAYFSQENVEEIFLPLLRRLTELQREKGGRALVFMAAPPGAGKSTLAAFLRELSLTHPGLCPLTVIGMDGFHRRQEYLLSHTTVRNGVTIPLVRIKGAPVTFDLDLLHQAIARVASGEECGWPVYDRLLHNPRENALHVSGELVLLEGNYLLLREDGWRSLRRYADYTVMIAADPALLRRRLITRHILSGKTPEEAAAFVDGSDLPNARTCLERSDSADLTLTLQPDDTFSVSASAPSADIKKNTVTDPKAILSPRRQPDIFIKPETQKEKKSSHGVL